MADLAECPDCGAMVDPGRVCPECSPIFDERPTLGQLADEWAGALAGLAKGPE